MRTMGTILAGLRRAQGLSQAEVAEWMTEHCEPVTNKAVSKWEQGDRGPSARQFVYLCQLYRVLDPVATFLPDETVERLNEEGLRRLQEEYDLLLQIPRYVEKPAPLQLPLFQQAASAGIGQFNDSSAYELVEVERELAGVADFGVHVAGDSMQPYIEDGSVVWVKKQNVLEPGRIGVFFYDGKTWIKQLRVEEKGLCLFSFNPDYAPLYIPEGEELVIQGEVVARGSGTMG